MRKPSILVIFLTVFIDLIGFGIVLPLLPIYSKNFGANGLTIGAIMASYSAMQFIFAPIWGRLSDRIGRRPVLLVSTASAAFSYAIFAMGSLLTGTTALVVILASRMLAGICGANITVAQAYIADITAKEERSKRMGLIGMAFGLGFIFGPALGALSLGWFGIAGPGWVAASFCAINWFIAFFILKESRAPASDHVPARPHFSQCAHTLGLPKVGLLIWVFGLATFSFSCFETTLGLLVGQNFHLDAQKSDDAKTIGWLFAYCGILGAFVQGGAIGYLVKKMGEPKLIVTSLLLVSLSLGVMPFAKSWPGLLVAVGVLAVGSSLARPPIFGLISNLTSAHEQGATIGVAQSMGSMARIIGPIFAASLFFHITPLPYLVCSAISLLTGVVAWQALCKPS